MIVDRIITFLDLETTGSKAGRDRVIEIGLIQYLNGKVINEYETLVNPECVIPDMITGITGIRNSDVVDAPLFKSIALKLYELIEDTIVVAHNVSFDYSFLRAEFAKLEVNLNNDILCSVKLSKDLYPHFKKHSLDSIIDRFNLTCERRHRALDDAKIISNFIQCAVNDFSFEKVSTAFRKNLKVINLPSKLSHKDLNKLPSSFGVYTFENEAGQVMYVGWAKNVYLEVTNHFLNQSLRRENILKSVTKVDFMPTFGELGAIFFEIKLTNDLKPIYTKKFKLFGKYLLVDSVSSNLPWWPINGYMCIEEQKGTEGQLFLFKNWRLYAVVDFNEDSTSLNFLPSSILEKGFIDILASKLQSKSGYKIMSEFELRQFEEIH